MFYWPRVLFLSFSLMCLSSLNRNGERDEAKGHSCTSCGSLKGLTRRLCKREVLMSLTGRQSEKRRWHWVIGVQPVCGWRWVLSLLFSSPVAFEVKQVEEGGLMVVRARSLAGFMNMHVPLAGPFWIQCQVKIMFLFSLVLRCGVSFTLLHSMVYFLARYEQLCQHHTATM